MTRFVTMGVFADPAGNEPFSMGVQVPVAFGKQGIKGGLGCLCATKHGCKAGDIAEKYFSEAFDQVLDALKETREEMEHEPDTDKQ